MKNKGNAALSSGKTEEAIDFYTQGIALDSSSQLLYSNRSAAYCKLGRYDEALKDAEEAIRLKPDWAKVKIFDNRSYILKCGIEYLFNAIKIK